MVDQDIKDLRKDVQQLALTQAELIGQLKATLPNLITQSQLSEIVRKSVARHQKSCTTKMSKGSIAKIGGLGGAFFLLVQALIDNLPALL